MAYPESVINQPADNLVPQDPEAAALVEEFAAGYPFELDDFQRQGCLALAGGRSTLVAAPTGAGKIGRASCRERV